MNQAPASGNLGMKSRAGGKREAKAVSLPARSTRNVLLRGVVLGLGMGLILAIWSAWGWRKVTSRHSLAQPAATQIKSTNCEVRIGPWGELVLSHLLIERPKEFLGRIPSGFLEPGWHFVGMDVKQITDLFKSSDLSPSQRSLLLDTNRWRALEGGWVIYPGTNVAWGLSRKARGEIYTCLGRFPENLMQHAPHSVPLAWESEWLQDGGLAPAMVSLLSSLIYERGETACFADMEVLNLLATKAEREQLILVLTRQPAVLARLRVGPETDIKSLVDYWERSKARRDLEPFLESLRHVPGETEVNVAFFLPPFARTRLYCYPDLKDDRIQTQDCFWTALNFFNTSPDDRYLDPLQRNRAVQSSYRPVESPPVLGDVILVLDLNDSPVHACVYIADNLIFTKNGATRQSPWVLMKMNDMMSYYSEAPVHLLVLRHRNNT